MKKIITIIILACSFSTYAQTGIGTANPDAMLHVLNADTATHTLKIEGLQNAIDTETISTMVIDMNGVVKTKAVSNSNSPAFFYMPSVLLPTNDTSTAYVTYTPAADTGTISGVYTVDIHAVFAAQFNSPVASSVDTPTISQTVLPRNAYEYNIIFADNTVFPNNEIKFIGGAGNEGKFTYKVNREAIVRNGSFMNIVLKVK